MVKLTGNEFMAIYTYIRKRYGINLENKQYLIESKLWQELDRCSASSYTEYWQLVRSDGTGVLEQRMVDLLTTNYTYFCREEEHFDFMTNRVVPEISRRGDAQLDVWCAACATGQECYTLAMYLLDCQAIGSLSTPFRIFGTDISEKALLTARKARYGSGDYSRLRPYWQRLYCSPIKDGEFEIQQRVRNHVTFQKHNLLEPLLTAVRFQAVFCRNVLIYFKENERNMLLETVNNVLYPGGYLFVSQTETLPGCKIPLDYIQPAVYMKPEVVQHV